MPVVDASFLVDLSYGRDAALHAAHRLADLEEPNLLPAQVAAEVLAGVEEPLPALRDLEETYQLVPFGKEELLRAAQLARVSQGAGRFPGWADAQIAAVASLETTYVVSANPEHFRALGCKVWDYRNERDPPE